MRFVDALTRDDNRNVGPAERWFSLALGAGLVAYGLTRQKKQPLAVLAGAALAARGITAYCPLKNALGVNGALDDTREALGGHRGIRLEESVTIRATANDLYAMWRPLNELPRFMPHIERIDVLDDRLSHWVVRGPAGLSFEWDAEIINDVRPDIVAWRSLPGAEVASAGSVKFRERMRGGETVTELTVTLQYEPAGGKAAAWLAKLTGSSPTAMLREDLRRFKAQLESGEAPTTEGRSAGQRSVLARAVGVAP